MRMHTRTHARAPDKVGGAPEFGDVLIRIDNMRYVPVIREGTRPTHRATELCTPCHCFRQLANVASLLGGFVVSVLFTTPIDLSAYPDGHAWIGYTYLIIMLTVAGMNLHSLSVNTL